MKFRLRSEWWAIALLPWVCRCTPGGLPLLGIDGKHQPKVASVSADRYRRELTAALTSFHRTVLPELEAMPAARSKWELQSVELGFYLSAKVGIGPFSVGIKPGANLFFSKTSGPPPL